MSTLPEPTDASQPSSALAGFLDRLWAGQEGFAHLAFGHGPHFDANGKYSHSNWSERAFPWPSARDYLVNIAGAVVEHQDVYYGVLLRPTTSRKKGAGLPGRHAWVDVDGAWTGDRHDAWLRLGEVAPGSLIVASGRGRHVYAALAEPASAAELEVWNRRLAYYFDGDSKWAENTVLRPPGTLNHKPAADGSGPATDVVVLEATDGPGATVKAFDAFLPPDPALRRSEGSTGPLVAVDVDLADLPEHLAALVSEEPGEDRSKQTYRLVCAAVRSGLDDAQVAGLARHHKPTVAKYGDGDRFDKQLAVVICRAKEEVGESRTVTNGRAPDESWVREPPPDGIHSSEPHPYRADESPDEFSDESGGPRVLRFRTAREVAQTTPSDVPWVAGPWVAAGSITEMSGKVKAGGKTTFVAAMTRCVVTGTPFMGQPTKQGPVVYLTEQNDTSFRLALTRAGLNDRDDVYILSWQDTQQANWPLVVAVAADKAAEVGAVMLVVDTLPQFAGLAGDAENNSGAALAAMVPLQRAAAGGLAVVVIRHDRKSGGEVGDSARGSTAFGGAVDVVLSIRRADGNRPNARVIHALSRFDETPVAVVVELLRPDSSADSSGADEYVMVGEEAAVTAELVATVVLAQLPKSEADAVAGAALAEALGAAGAKRTTVWEVLGRLLEQGEVCRKGAGKKGDPYLWWNPATDPSAPDDPADEYEGPEDSSADSFAPLGVEVRTNRIERAAQLDLTTLEDRCAECPADVDEVDPDTGAGWCAAHAAERTR